CRGRCIQKTQVYAGYTQIGGHANTGKGNQYAGKPCVSITLENLRQVLLNYSCKSLLSFTFCRHDRLFGSGIMNCTSYLIKKVIVRITLGMDVFYGMVNQRFKLLDIFFFGGRYENGRALMFTHPAVLEIGNGERLVFVALGTRFLKCIDLVEYGNDRFLQYPQVFERLVNGLNLVFEVMVGNVHNMEKDIGFAHFFQSRLKAFNQVVREL